MFTGEHLAGFTGIGTHAQPHHDEHTDFMELLDGPSGLGGITERRGYQQAGVVVLFLAAPSGDEEMQHFLSSGADFPGGGDNTFRQNNAEAFFESYFPGELLNKFRAADFG